MNISTKKMMKNRKYILFLRDVLREIDNGNDTVKGLANKFDLFVNISADMVRKLEKIGLIETKIVHRVKKIKLSKYGKKFLKSLSKLKSDGKPNMIKIRQLLFAWKIIRIMKRLELEGNNRMSSVHRKAITSPGATSDFYWLLYSMGLIILDRIGRNLYFSLTKEGELFYESSLGYNG